MKHDHANPERAGELHHVELYASDLDASVDFWGWLLGELGYEAKNEWDGGCSWINGPTYLVLVEAGRTDAPFDRRAPGLNHLAFHAASREGSTASRTASGNERTRPYYTKIDTPTPAATTRSTVRIRKA